MSTSGTHGFTDSANVLDGGVLDFLANVGAPAPGNGVELEGGEACFDDLGCALGERFGRGIATGPAVGIDANLVAARAADELMHGRAVCLARDVPHGVFEAADGAVVVHSAAPAGEVVERHLHEMLDVGGVAADKVALELIDVRRNLHVAVRLGVALAPAVDALVGLYLHEAKVLGSAGVYQEGLDISNLHWLLILSFSSCVSMFGYLLRYPSPIHHDFAAVTYPDSSLAR